MKTEQPRLAAQVPTASTKAGVPEPDFLGHLQERLGLDERLAAEQLRLWMSTYEPGPRALADARGRREASKSAAA